MRGAQFFERLSPGRGCKPVTKPRGQRTQNKSDVDVVDVV